MAEAPNIKVPQVQINPARPVYQDASGASGLAFGANRGRDLADAGEGLGQVSNALARAAVDIAQRRNAIGRAKAMSDFEAFANDTWIATQTNSDITDPATIQSFNQGLQDKTKEFIDQHAEQYGAASADQLMADLTNESNNYLGRAASTAAETSQTMIAQSLGGQLSKYAPQVAAHPDQLNDYLDKWNRDIDNYAPALTPQQEAMYRKQGAAAFTSGMIDNILYQPNGDQTVQRMLQANPGILEVFDPQQQEAIRGRIQTVANANAESRNRMYTLSPGTMLVNGQGQTVAYAPEVVKPERTPAQTAMENVATYEAITGKKATPEMWASVLNLDPGSAAQSLADKTNDFVQAMTIANGGVAPTKQQQIDFVNSASGIKVDDPARKLAEISAIREKAKLPPLTQAQTDALLGIKEDGNKSLSEKLAEAETIVGDLTPDQIAKLGGFYVAPQDEKEGSTFGNSLEGRTLDMFAKMAPDYAAGRTTSDQDREFETAAYAYAMTPVGVDVDPYTQQKTYRYRSLPPHVAQALSQRGVKWRVPAPGEPPPQPMIGDPNSVAPSTGEQQPGQTQGGDQQPSGAPTKANAAQQFQNDGKTGPTKVNAAQQFGGAAGGQNAPGMLEPGNIDLHNRPKVKNADGRISTVRSISFEENGKEVLIPSVAADGSKILSNKEAIDQYHKTGQFLGKFDTPQNADAYAQQLHQEQEQEYTQQEPAQTSRDAQQPAGGPTKNDTILELGAKHTGPQQTLAREIHGIPYAGKNVGGEATQAEAFINSATNDLVRVLQSNPRFAEGERKQIKEEINTSLKFIDDPQRYIDSVMGLRKSMLVRLENAKKTSMVENLGSEERTMSYNTINAIENFLSVLTPPVFDTVAEAKAWAAKQGPQTPFVLKKAGGSTYELRYTSGAKAPKGE